MWQRRHTSITPSGTCSRALGCTHRALRLHETHNAHARLANLALATRGTAMVGGEQTSWDSDAHDGLQCREAVTDGARSQYHLTPSTPHAHATQRTHGVHTHPLIHTIRVSSQPLLRQTSRIVQLTGPFFLS